MLFFCTGRHAKFMFYPHKINRSIVCACDCARPLKSRARRRYTILGWFVGGCIIFCVRTTTQYTRTGCFIKYICIYTLVIYIPILYIQVRVGVERRWDGGTFKFNAKLRFQNILGAGNPYQHVSQFLVPGLSESVCECVLARVNLCLLCCGSGIIA